MQLTHEQAEQVYKSLSPLAGYLGFVFSGLQVYWIQTLDLSTNALVWERPFEERRIIPPPP